MLTCPKFVARDERPSQAAEPVYRSLDRFPFSFGSKIKSIGADKRIGTIGPPAHSLLLPRRRKPRYGLGGGGSNVSSFVRVIDFFKHPMRR